MNGIPFGAVSQSIRKRFIFRHTHTKTHGIKVPEQLLLMILIAALVNTHKETHTQMFLCGESHVLAL